MRATGNRAYADIEITFPVGKNWAGLFRIVSHEMYSFLIFSVGTCPEWTKRTAIEPELELTAEPTRTSSPRGGIGFACPEATR